MSDPTKPPVTAVAMAHKAPSKASIDTAQDELANLQYKLGRAQVAAMLSAGQAKADKAALADLEKLVQEKRAAVEAMVETFTNQTAPDPAIALAAIREKIEGAATRAPADPELPAGIIEAGRRVHRGDDPRAMGLEIRRGDAWIDRDERSYEWDGYAWKATGGKVESRKAYLVGEQSGESIAPASSAPKRLQDPESLDWGNDTVADKGTAVAGVAYVTRTGDIVGEIRTAQAGDVLVGDGSGAAAPEYVGLDLATKPDQHVDVIDLPFVTTVDQVRALAKAEKEFPTSTRPPESPKQGDVWAYPMKAAPWVVQMLWDKVSGWSIPLEGDPTQFREVRGTDLTADYWEAAELQKIIDQARPRKKLFPLMGRG